MRDLEVPKKYRRMYDRAMAGRSQSAAIRAHCVMCCGWQAKEVRPCTARDCPLYPYRLTGRKPRIAAPSRIRVEENDAESSETGEVVRE